MQMHTDVFDELLQTGKLWLFWGGGELKQNGSALSGRSGRIDPNINSIDTKVNIGIGSILAQ